MKTAALLGISVLVFAIGVVLATSQLTRADDAEISAQGFLDTYCGGAIPADTEVEVEDGTDGAIGGACTVDLNDESEVEFGKDVTLDVGGKFTLSAVGGAEDVEIQFGENNEIDADGIEWIVGVDGEIQVKKNSTITSDGDVKMQAGDDGEIQFEENTELHATSKIELLANDEDGEIQIKKVDPAAADPNITATEDIIMTANGEDGEVQIEEGNWIEAGKKIEVTANGTDGEVQTKKNVSLHAKDGEIKLLAEGTDGEVQAAEDNTFCASSKINLKSNGATGETEVKVGTDLYAGAGGAGDFDIAGAEVEDNSAKHAFSDCPL